MTSFSGRENDPLQYLSFGATFSRTFSLFADRFDVFLALSAIVLVPFCILVITITLFTISSVIRSAEIPEFHPTHLPLMGSIFALQAILYAVVTIVGRGAMIRAVAEMYLGEGRQVNWYACLRKSLEQFWSLLGASMMVAGGMILGAMIPFFFIIMASVHTNVIWIMLACTVGITFLVAGVFIFISLIMSSPAIVIEQRTAIQGLQRSWELSNGSRCYIFCTLFLMWFINNMVSRLLSNIFMTGDAMDILFSVAGIVVTILPLLVFFPLHAILETVVYLNLRVGRESLNHQVLSADLNTQGGGSRPMPAFRGGGIHDAVASPMDYQPIQLDMDSMEKNESTEALMPRMESV